MLLHNGRKLQFCSIAVPVNMGTTFQPKVLAKVQTAVTALSELEYRPPALAIFTPAQGDAILRPPTLVFTNDRELSPARNSGSYGARK